MFEIETNVPPPAEFLPKPKGPKYPFVFMKAPYKNGDKGLTYESFRVAASNGDLRRVKQRLSVACAIEHRKQRKVKGAARFVARPERGGVRVWRIA